VPKILAVFGALAVTGGWLMSTLLGYTVGLFNALPQMVR
jgi:flagellar biosynthesis protein FliQ